MWLNSHTFKNSDTQWQHPGGRRALWKVQTSKEKVTTVGESIKTWLKGTTVLTEWMDYLQLQQSNTHVQGKGKKKNTKHRLTSRAKPSRLSTVAFQWTAVPSTTSARQTRQQFCIKTWIEIFPGFCKINSRRDFTTTVWKYGIDNYWIMKENIYSCLWHLCTAE